MKKAPYKERILNKIVNEILIEEKARFKINEHIWVPGNAQGTVWESGYVKAIRPEGYIIGFGDVNDSFLLYGQLTPHSENELRPYDNRRPY